MDHTAPERPRRKIAVAEVGSAIILALASVAYGRHQEAGTGHTWTTIGTYWLAYSVIVALAVANLPRMSSRQQRLARIAAHLALVPMALILARVLIEDPGVFDGWSGGWGSSDTERTPRSRRRFARIIAVMFGLLSFPLVAIGARSALAGVVAALLVSVGMYFFTRLLYGKHWNEEPPHVVDPHRPLQ